MYPGGCRTAGGDSHAAYVRDRALDVEPYRNAEGRSALGRHGSFGRSGSRRGRGERRICSAGCLFVLTQSLVRSLKQIQKGVLQVNRALSFLHTQAHLIHNNLSPEAILVNLKGDWKLGSLNFTLSLGVDGQGASRWEFPEWESRLPEGVQRNWDYMGDYLSSSSLSSLRI